LSELHYVKIAGQCNSCKEWNTIAEEIIQKKEKTMNRLQQSSKAFKLTK
jgi:DNA repair protein RadA/Sms